MNKSDLIAEAVRRGGLAQRDAARGVETALAIIKRELGSDHQIHIRGLGRLHLRPKRAGFLPAVSAAAPLPIPAGKAVKLKASRKAVASLNARAPELANMDNTGGIIAMKHDQ